jgi:Ca2+-binding RTX toxin-like protein
MWPRQACWSKASRSILRRGTNNAGAADQITFSEDGKLILVHDNNTGKLQLIDLHPRDQQIDGTAGADALAGGRGDDTYIVNHAGDTITELEFQGTDIALAGVTFTLPAYVENLTLTGTAADGTGNQLDNVITGNGLANTLIGAGGLDWMAGGGGDDVLLAGPATTISSARMGTTRSGVKTGRISSTAEPATIPSMAATATIPRRSPAGRPARTRATTLSTWAMPRPTASRRPAAMTARTT